MLTNESQNCRRTEVLTADPQKILIMCFEKMIQNLKKAMEKYASSTFELTSGEIQNTVDILTELRSQLDLERGGVIAKNLSELYAFWKQHILTADQTRNPKDLAAITAMMEEIKSAFEKSRSQTLGQPNDHHPRIPNQP